MISITYRDLKTHREIKVEARPCAGNTLTYDIDTHLLQEAPVGQTSSSRNILENVCGSWQEEDGTPAQNPIYPCCESGTCEAGWRGDGRKRDDA